jgi:hypothetical protein
MIHVKLEHKPKSEEQNEKWVATIEAEPAMTIESATKSAVMGALVQEFAERWPNEEMVLEEVAS